LDRVITKAIIQQPSRIRKAGRADVTRRFVPKWYIGVNRMPLGKTETISSMGGPKQTTYYDAKAVEQMKKMITATDMQMRQVERDKKLSGLDKYKITEKLKDTKELRKDRLNKYTNDAKTRDRYRKDYAKLKDNYIEPQIDLLRETGTKNSAWGEPASTPSTQSAATTGESKVNSVGFGDWTKDAEYVKTQIADPSGLSVRTRNFLNNNVKTIEELLSLTEDQVRKSRNTSKDTWVEIQNFKADMALDLAKVGDPEDVTRLSKMPDMWKQIMSGDYVKPKDPKVKMDQTIKQLEGFIGDLDRKIATEAVEKSKKVSLPAPKKSLAGVFKGLGRATVAGLAEAPAFEFLSPPSAGPSDPEDPVNQFERGQMSSEDFAEYLKKTAGARKKTNYFDPLQTMIRSMQGK
jgi:hypothetical protein